MADSLDKQAMFDVKILCDVKPCSFHDCAELIFFFWCSQISLTVTIDVGSGYTKISQQIQ